MADHPDEPPFDEDPGEGSGSGTPGEAEDGTSGGYGAMWAFLPIGVTFMVLGISQGLGDGGTPFFVVGIAFLTFALTQVKRRRGQDGPPPPED